MDLARPLAVRVSFVVLAVACYFVTLALLAEYPALDQTNTMGTLEWLIGAIGVAIAGDTVRPSGQRVSSLVAPKVDP